VGGRPRGEKPIQGPLSGRLVPNLRSRFGSPPTRDLAPQGTAALARWLGRRPVRRGAVSQGRSKGDAIWRPGLYVSRGGACLGQAPDFAALHVRLLMTSEG